MPTMKPHTGPPALGLWRAMGATHGRDLEGITLPPANPTIVDHPADPGYTLLWHEPGGAVRPATPEEAAAFARARTRLYLSGPMRHYPDDNYPAFHAATADLCGQGYAVINPAANFEGRRDLPLAVYMRRDIADLLTAHELRALDGWHRSDGALLEIRIAQVLGLPCRAYPSGQDLPDLHAMGLLPDPAAIAAWQGAPAEPAPARPLIGLVGHKGAGKDTVAALLGTRHGYTRRAFADALKEETYWAFGLALLEKIAPHAPDFRSVEIDAWHRFLDAHKYDDPSTEYGWVRPLLQYWGTEYRRALCGEDYWVDQLRPSLGPGVVVSDVRFPNEAQAILDAGGTLWRISRPGYGGDDHASEATIRTLPYDWTILNAGSLDGLAASVDRALLDTVRACTEGKR